MSRKKGLSADEKKVKLLELFHEKKEPFPLKEVEKLAPKLKGIRFQVVKEVVEELVAEGLVQTDKVGASTLFWAFPSAGLQQRNVRIAQLDDTLASMKATLEELQTTQATLSEGREESEERAQMEIELKQMMEEEERLEAELQKFIDFDPEHVEEMEKRASVAFDAANRWTDNVFNVITWLKNKMNMESRDLRAQFQIPDDFDYVEE
eukprot:TRINITY_DN3714_c0_g1_i1.p1 TRINITY_DN3714_c0_g1~~TRINITY_DN3714_c0_g1_i1.p1  ORF type:complete len:207 (-),score=84.71 TRINITY_DN3714_c0_g1_i1:47-667(-)